MMRGQGEEQEQRLAFPSLSTNQRQEYIDRLECILYTNIRPWWLGNSVVDLENGGFTLNHDINGNYLGPAPKMIVTQARITWFFSRLLLFEADEKEGGKESGKDGGQNHEGMTEGENKGERARGLKSNRSENLAMAMHGFRFLKDRMWDRANGGFVWRVAADGKTVVEGTFKDLYGQAFGLYALSYYYMATGDREALAMASQLFDLLYTRCHDTTHGGFFEAPFNDWSLDPAHFQGAIQRRSPKTINTHLHLLESLVAFHRALKEGGREEGMKGGSFEEGEKAEEKKGRGEDGREGRVETVIRELIALATGKMLIDPPGTVVEFYASDWTPDDTPNLLLFGHVNELLWLVVDACESLDIRLSSLPPSFLSSLWIYSTTYGFDQTQGAFQNQRVLETEKPLLQPLLQPSLPFAQDDDKVWWVQAESLIAAAKYSRIDRGEGGGEGGIEAGEAFGALLKYLNGTMIDWERGEWFAEVKEGRKEGGKANEWKGPYHNGRAIILCLEELRGRKT